MRFEWPDGETGPDLGVIINADCDLMHGKTDGVIALLPIYSFYDYLRFFWAPSYMHEVIAASTQAILKLANDDDATALHDWLTTAGVEKVSSSIAMHNGLKKGQVEQLGRELKRLAVCLDAGQDAIMRFQQLCHAAADPAGYARTQISSAKKAMGEGHFFISDLIDEQSVGFVIRMRRIYTVPEHNYFTATSEQMSKSQGTRVTAVRVAKLTELYRVKVLQLFSQQYSRIGLPDDVTALSSLAIDDIVAKFSGEHK
ncbi:hypothetical protein [Ciceribacter thiooxidans]|uniref:Uncharacterized protein n=1 Tax=Ciceribacter thiooxidans TaxID=1969821 RepID=A0ABV7I2G9_9HYPH|nr:hypothetical protein [Ciceribacter thiooxidans]